METGGRLLKHTAQRKPAAARGNGHGKKIIASGRKCDTRAGDQATPTGLNRYIFYRFGSRLPIYASTSSLCE